MRLLKQIVHRIVRSQGYYLAHIPGTGPHTPDPLMFHNFELLLDVGANTGQYAMEKRARGYSKKIVSFEPLPDAHKQLEENAKFDQQWVAHERCAVGADIGSAQINIAGNSWSSSLRSMTTTHVTAAPESAYVGVATTDVITLDSIFPQYRKADEKTFLKIDTQGYEWEVLEGAVNSLSQIAGIQLELSIKPLYEGQKLYLPIINRLDELGFTMWDIELGMCDLNSQRLQFDGIFIRP